MGVNCITCKNQECANHGKNIYFGWDCEKYINNEYTNADMIRNMTDEELARWISGGARCSDSICSYCKNNKIDMCNPESCKEKTDTEIVLDWLKRPIKTNF